LLTAFIAFAALLALGALWLALRPLPLAFAIPTLEGALSAKDGRYTVEIRQASLVWSGLELGLKLRAEGVQVLRSDGNLLLGAPHVLIGMSGPALLRGRLAVDEIRFEEPSLQVIRRTDGQLEILVEGEEQTNPSEATARVEFVDYLLGQLAGEPDPNLPLDRIALSDAKLTLDDRGTDMRWHASDVDVELRRESDGIVGQLSLDAQVSGPDITRAGAPIRVRGNIEAHPDGPELELGLSTRIATLPVDALADWWPKGAAEGARSWVVRHIRGGRIGEVEVDATLRMQRVRPRNPSLTRLGGRLTAQGLSVRYAKGWPAATSIETVATLDEDTLRFVLHAGSIAGLDVQRGSVDVLGLVEGPLRIDVRTEVHGPLARLTEMLALEPLNLFARVGVDPGQPPGDARASVDLSIRPNHAPLIVANGFSLASPEANLRGRFEPDANGAIRHLDLDPLRIGTNDLSLKLERAESKGYALDLRGKRADVSPWLREGVGGEKGLSTGTSHDVRVEAALAEIEVGSGIPLRDVRASARRRAGRWRSLAFDAALPSKHSVSLKLVPVGAGSKLDVRCNDLGSLLRATTGSERLSGGTFALQATQARFEAPIEGHAELRDSTLAATPTLTRLLQGLSLPGLLSALRGQGLEFSLWESDFRYAKGIAALSEAHGVHPSLLLRFDGRVDLEQSIADIRGTAVPFVSANKLIDRVPILGGLITGGGQGVIAADFQIEGPLSDPEVDVSALSAITPNALDSLTGFLRQTATDAGASLGAR
jgi:hypothetical protein